MGQRFDDFSNDIFNSRVQDAMRRIEIKYSHKNNLNRQQDKIKDKRKRDIENIFNRDDYLSNNNDNDDKSSNFGMNYTNNLNHQPNKNHKNSGNENFFCRTQTLAFSNSFIKKKPTTLDGCKTSEIEYNNSGHAYLDKINQDEEKRQSKLNTDMRIFNDKITDIQKNENSH